MPLVRNSTLERGLEKENSREALNPQSRGKRKNRRKKCGLGKVLIHCKNPCKTRENSLNGGGGGGGTEKKFQMGNVKSQHPRIESDKKGGI